MASLDGFDIWTGDEYKQKIEEATYATLIVTNPATDGYALQQSTAEITGLDGVLEEDILYSFSVYPVNDLPQNAYWTMFIPTAIGLPSDPASDLTFTCTLNCDDSGVRTWDATNRIMTFNGVYPDYADYLYAGNEIQFTLDGFTNPSTSDFQYFLWKSYAVLDGGAYQIDELSNMYIAADQGECIVSDFYPTDDNQYIYGVASNWTFAMVCEHDVDTDFGMQIEFPEGFYIRETAKCTLGYGDSDDTLSGYSCVTDTDLRTITMYSFTTSGITAGDDITFTVDNIMNPGVEDLTDQITFSTISDIGGIIDTGTFSLTSDFFERSYIKQFTVRPQDFGVGQYPVFYDFTIQPAGEVWRYSYFVITIPDDVGIY